MQDYTPIKGPIRIDFNEKLTPRIIDDEVQLVDDQGNIKARVTHENDGVVTINDIRYFFKNGKIILKAFW